MIVRQRSLRVRLARDLHRFGDYLTLRSLLALNSVFDGKDYAYSVAYSTQSPDSYIADQWDQHPRCIWHRVLIEKELARSCSCALVLISLPLRAVQSRMDTAR